MNGPTRERGGASRPQGEAPSPSVDVLAAQVREALNAANEDVYGPGGNAGAFAALAALVARVIAAEDDSHLLADCQRGRKAAQDEAFRRGDEVGRLTAALADARNALERIAENAEAWHGVTPERFRIGYGQSQALSVVGGWAREVLARLDGSGGE